MSAYRDFLVGKFDGVSLTREGRLTLAPSLDKLFTTDQPVVWSATVTPDGSAWLATGHGGRLYRVDRSGKGEVIFRASEPEIFAVASDSAGRVYAATSPDGKVYRIENGKASEYFSPGATYIWSLVCAPDGALFAGTGGEGKVYRVRPAQNAGIGELWFDSGQAHITALALDPQGRLLAGSEPNGILYRIEGKQRAFALYDSPLPEIRSIRITPNGDIYAAAMGGGVERQSQAAQTAAAAGAQVSVSATVAVTDAPAQKVPEIKPQAVQAPGTQAAPPAVAPAPAIDYGMVERSALYRISADNSVETLWTSNEENLYDIAASGETVYLSTDKLGRVYEMDSRRRTRLLVETHGSESVRLASQGRALLLASAHPGALFRIGESTANKGEYESPVHGATAVARWGKLRWKAETCAGCTLTLRTRSGNSARPDSSWSEWSAPLTIASGSQIVSPNARFIQWKAELAGSGASPVLSYVRLAYLPQNTSPRITSITVGSQAKAADSSKATAAAPSQAYSITVADSGETAASSLTGTATQPVTRSPNEQLHISWVAEDSDGDKLVYAVYFRGDDQREWKLLRENLTEASHVIDAESLADGRYFFRVTVSDRAANPPAASRDDELVSASVIVDRTPPRIEISQREVKAADETSPLTRCEYSLDAGLWTVLTPADGVVDSQGEIFELPAPSGRGERLLVVRCYDAANNAGTARRVLQ
jgi:hypothetical protein